MTRQNKFLLFLLIMSILLLGGCKEYSLTVIVNGDGTCVIKREMTHERIQVEMYVNKMEARFGGTSDGEDGTQTEPGTGKNAQGTLSEDEQLRARFLKYGSGNAENDNSFTVDANVQEDSVTVIETKQFEDIESFLEALPNYTDGYGMGLDHEDGRLKATLAPPDGEWGVYAKNSLTQRISALDRETCRIKIILPGKIISSDLGQMDDNSTWLSLDPKSDSDRKNASTLVDKDSVSIVCEMGGLVADLPISSFGLLTATEEASQPKIPELDVTDARPGFMVLPYMLTINEKIYFNPLPQELKERQERWMAFGNQEEGINLKCHLYAPKEVCLLSVESVRALSMTDDTGKTAKLEEKEPEHYFRPPELGTRDNKGINFRLPLPDHSAKALETVQCEAIVMVSDGWKQIPIQGNWVDSKEKTDLSGVIPGAYMTVKEMRKEPGMGYTLIIEVIGPPEVHFLSFSDKLPASGMPERDDDSISIYNVDYVAHGEQVKATFEAELNFSGSLQDLKNVSAPFYATFPINLKRERVHFKLQGLDLM